MTPELRKAVGDVYQVQSAIVMNGTDVGTDSNLTVLLMWMAMWPLMSLADIMMTSRY